MENRLTVRQIVDKVKKTMKPGQTEQFPWRGDFDLEVNDVESECQKHFGARVRIRVCRPFTLEVTIYQVDASA